MATLFEPLKVAQRVSAHKIKQASDMLREYFNINSFFYSKVCDSGKLVIFEPIPDVADCYESQNFILKYPFCHPKYRTAGFEMGKIIEDPQFVDAEETRESFLRLDLNLSIKIVSKTDNMAEEFGFNSALCSAEQCLFLANHLSDLKLFIKWFFRENQSMFSFLEENAVDIGNILGRVFYENRIHASNVTAQKRERFLQELRIDSKTKLSSAEQEIVQLVLKGYSASMIGHELFRSKRTIEHRLENIKAKLNCSSKQELVEKATDLLNFQ